jgi:transcriptional regulator with XRE-family HTH domain
MASIESQTVSYDVALMIRDMAAKGFLRTDLARKADVSAMAVTRFFSGERQTARMAKKLAGALGYSVRRYLISSREAVA